MGKCTKFSKFVTKAIESLSNGDLDKINLSVHDFQTLEQIETIEALKGLQSRLLELESQHQSFSSGKFDLTLKQKNKKDRLWQSLKAISATQKEYINDVERVIAGQFSDIKFERAEDDKLGNALQRILENFKYVIWRLGDIAQGDVRAKIAPLNEKDELGIGLDDVTRSLREVTKIAESVANGDLNANLKTKGKHDLLGKSINMMIDNLCSVENQHIDDSWIKTGQNELSDCLRGEQELQQLTRNVVSFLAKYIGANVGVIYLFNAVDNTLEMAGSYAYTHRRQYQNKIKMGEGLLGQVALEKQAIILSDAPKDYLELASSLGNTSPNFVLIAPIFQEEQLKGVIELGSLEPISNRALKLVELVSENIAIAIKSNVDHSRLQDLLEQTQKHQEELKANNDELEKHTQVLKQNEEELQTQSEELQQTNEELEEKTEYLQKQKQEIEKKNQHLEEARQTIEEKAKELENTNRYKSEFLANMSHELRTPLNSIMILAGLLEDNDEGNLSDDQVESAGVVLSSAGDLLALINDILDLSKVEAGKMTAHVESIDLESLFTNLKLEFDALALKKGLNIIIDSATNVPERIQTDRQRVSQIVRNLVSNAIKFTQKGTITIKVFCPERNIAELPENLRNKDSIAISVIDTGVGIPEEKQRLIFEAFQQADGSTSREFGGSGLGLTISRQFARLLKGDIHLESHQGRGCTFTLYLPVNNNDTEKNVFATEPVVSIINEKELLPAPQPQPQLTEDDSNIIEEFKAQSEATTPEIHGDYDPEGKNILLIEDDLNFCYTLKEVGNKNGYNSLIASGGEAGLALAAQYHPNGIILDLNLPDIHGTEVLQRLKADPITMDIPVHIISGMEEISNAQEQGATGFLKKPGSQDDIKYVFDKIAPINNKGDKHILLIEDNKDNRESIVKLLQKDGIVIDSVATGTEAQVRLEEKVYDCIISDLSLPDTNGMDLIKELKNNPSLKIPPIIAYTGKDLSKEEHDDLANYTESIVSKGGKSPTRLLDEVELFIHHVESTLPPEKRFQVAASNVDNGVFKNKRILIVDDDMRNTFALSKALNSTGMEIYLADNGEIALQKLKEHSNIALVLMDIMMPVMNGYEAMGEMRNSDKFKDIPVIALTAKAMPEDRAKCLEAGADDYITKPVDIAVLMSMLRVWLNKQ